jgi:hypothetical protein
MREVGSQDIRRTRARGFTGVPHWVVAHLTARGCGVGKGVGECGRDYGNLQRMEMLDV